MPKLQIFYGVWTTDNEMYGSFKAYAQTRELAEEELKKHKDFFCSTSPIPDDKHIVPLNMLVDDECSSKVQKVGEFNQKSKLQFSKEIYALYSRADEQYKAEQTRTSEEKEKEYEQKAEEQARYYIENLIFPSLAKVITESKIPAKPKAHFVINEITKICNFFCGVLDSDGWCQDPRYISVKEESVVIDSYILKVMIKISREYGLLSHKEVYDVENVDTCFWIEIK